MDYAKLFDKLYDKAIPLISVPGLPLLLYFLPYLKLDPLTRWDIDSGWRFVPCFVGGYIGYLLPRRNSSIMTKAWVGGVFGVIGFVTPFLYTRISSEAPTEENVEWISLLCGFLFLLTYFALGFFFSNLGKLPQKSD